jgi:hypothetical protein
MNEDTDRALAQIKAALDAGPTPGPWDAFHKHKYDEWHVSVPLSGQSMSLALFSDGCPTDRPQADAQLIAACNPSNMAAIVARLDAQAAEIERLRADAERYRWLRCNYDFMLDVDPNWPDWKLDAMIDAARGKK